ncbi:TonB-dependent receptor [Bacteroides ihuae]|uniref:TonB-dependent receptor n=1 Tax=Bacteroides ihuae TaxID=1852362 RepID=UPI0008D91375|nr:TonB-dependent receptor [Bacteroides ihuae]
MKSSSKRTNLHFAVFLLALLLWSPLCIHAQLIKRTFPQEKLSARIKQLAEITDKTITFDAAQVGNIVVPALAANNYNLEQILAGSLNTTGYTFKYTNNSYIIYRSAEDDNKKKTKSAGTGNLSGFILDQKGEPLVGATVRIPNTQLGTVTNLEGKYSLKAVPTGIVTVEASYVSFETLKITEVKINPARTTELDLVMKEASEELGEVVVTAEYSDASAKGLYAKQKTMAAMSDGVSADLIKKTSDNNVAQVLKRVSGVTIDNGKYVTIRGMGERYNNVQLNGATLPSTEPNRRNFAFDVIPSNLIDNVTISKTFTPDLPGEFTGGLVEVQTLSVPQKSFFTVTLGTGMNTQSTGKDFLSTKRYGSDWLLGEKDKRQWYEGKGEETRKQNIQNASQMNSYGFKKYTASPMQNYSLTWGLPLDLGNNQKLGFVAAVTYRNEQTTDEIKEAHMITRDSIYKSSHRYKFVTSTGAVANVGWEMPNHRITWRNLYNNRFTHTNMERYLYGYYTSFESTQKFYEQYSVPLISSLIQTQLDGEHHLFNKNLIFTWNGSYNKVRRTNPDDRYARGAVQAESGDKSFIDWRSATLSSGVNLNDGNIMYSDLKETKKTVGGNLEHSFVVAGNSQRLKAGYMGTFRSSDFEQQYLRAYGNASGGPSIQDYFAPESFSSGLLEYIQGGQGDGIDFYDGKQTIHAAYLMGEFSFFRKLHFTTGFRMEDAKTEVHTKFSSYIDGEGYQLRDSIVSVKKKDWLPAATLVYNITNEINARLAYSSTIARPDFREMTPTQYYNVDDRVTVVGVGAIKQSRTDNFDLRLEWYPHAGEVISVSGFYKKFKDPVEMVTVEAASQQSFDLFAFNLDDATVKGIEFNVRKSLGFIGAGTFFKDIYVSGNATIIKGDVTYNYDKLMAGSGSLKDIETQDRNRPLQGLSPYTVNAGLAYQGMIVGAALNYGRSGRKLVMAGEEEKYDQYETPRDVLDLQLSARFMKERLEFKFNASDLLNQDAIVYRNCGYKNGAEVGQPDVKTYEDRTALGMNYNAGDWVLSRIKRGVNLSFSIGYKF